MYVADNDTNLVEDIYQCPKCGTKQAIRAKRHYTAEQIEAETKP